MTVAEVVGGVIVGFVACLCAFQGAREAAFQASLIYTPGAVLRASTHMLIELAE